MIVALSSAGVRVPSGFATTAAAYREFVSANGLAPDIRSHLEAYRAGKTSLAEAGRAIRGRFLESAFPSAIADRISAAYEELGERLRLPDPATAVRSSATAEDLPDAKIGSASCRERVCQYV